MQKNNNVIEKKIFLLTCICLKSIMGSEILTNSININDNPVIKMNPEEKLTIEQQTKKAKDMFKKKHYNIYYYHKVLVKEVVILGLLMAILKLGTLVTKNLNFSQIINESIDDNEKIKIINGLNSILFYLPILFFSNQIYKYKFYKNNFWKNFLVFIFPCVIFILQIISLIYKDFIKIFLFFNIIEIILYIILLIIRYYCSSKKKQELLNAIYKELFLELLTLNNPSENIKNPTEINNSTQSNIM